MSRFLQLAATAALCFAAVSQLCAQTVTTVINNGTTQSRYDIVILGDGYQANEQTTFNNDVNAFLTALFQKQPFSTFSSYYNVHTVFRASQDSGADHPDVTPPIFVNTAYEATYNTGGTPRCLYIQNTSLALADAALAPATEGRVMVMVNDSRYGGCAATFAVSYNGSQMTEVQAHELGHSMGELADEYDYPNGTFTGNEPSRVNITKSPTGQKWSIWHGTDGISAFEGAGYYQFGLWRPRANCLMRSLGNVLCRVCQENIVKITNSFANAITNTVPTSSSVGIQVPNVQTFSFGHFVPANNSPTFEWEVDGVLQPTITTTNFMLDSTQWPLGAHTVKATVIDNTDRVRSDPANVLRHSYTWQVQISDPTAAQLRFVSMTSSQVLVNPGDEITVTPQVINDGPAAAGPFAIEFFLSDSSSGWTTQDTYLGRIEINNLGVGQVITPPTVLQLPWSMPTQLQHVHGVIDRENAVAESDETDNEIVRTLLGQTGPCTTGLEFQDDLVPVGSASLSITAGGTLHPTVVAPCADPATTLYLIAWTGSGTAPGTPLGGGLVLPLNFDSFTQAGLDGLNGGVFGGFLGLLDAQGVGQAQFQLPPSTAIPTGTTHFATVLLGATQLFTAVSNPVTLTLVP